MKHAHKTILVADDDQAILESMQLLLELNDYKVITSSGEDAIALVENHHPDIVLFDLWLGSISGKHLCQALRANPKFSKTPIILVSASNEIRHTYQEYGASDFVEKPFDIDLLMEKIEALT
ncbi:MAG: hypothetical protein QG639_931 [Patescibacteria group bacterium]|nr:hypothetical protein [Patescibacteria group bacterium]